MIRRRRAIVAFALAILLGLAGCVPVPDSAPPTLDLLDGQRSAVIGTSAQYGAFRVAFGYAVYDEVAETLAVGTRWENLSDDYATAPARFGALRLRVPDGGEPVAGELAEVVTAPVPPGTSAELTFLWRYLDADPLASGELLLGGPDERVASVALTGGAGDEQLAARATDLDTWGNLGPHTLHLTNATVSAGRWSDNTQADADHRILRVKFDVWASTASRVGWLASDWVALRLPDGGIVKSTPVPAVREVVWSAIDDSWAEFAIPDAGAGDYQLLLFRDAPGIFGEPVVGNTALPLAFTLGDELFRGVGAADRPAVDELPVPRVPERRDPAVAAPDPGSDRPFEVDAAPVDAAGYALDLVGGTVSPSRGGVVLELDASYLGEVVDDGSFSVPPSLTLDTALEFDGRMAGAILIATGARQRVELLVPGVPADFDPSSAVLHLGRNARIAFDGEATPGVPEEKAATAESARAGEYRIDVHGYRAGYFTGLDAPAGYVELEISYDVTTTSDADARTTFFNPLSQVYLARDDGYVTIASPLDLTGIQQLEVGVPRPLTTTFLVPAGFVEQDTIYLLVRSRDETDFPTPLGWLQTTIPVHL